MRRRRPHVLVFVGLVLALGLLLIEPVPPASAATLTVTSALDEPDANPGDGQCLSAPSGVCTLRAAIMEANGQGGASTITLPAGTFKLTIPGENEDGGATGDLDVYTNLTISGAGPSSTIVDGNQLDRVFDGRGSVTTLSIAHVTIMGGGGDGAGEGVRMTAGSLSVTDATVTQNAGRGLSGLTVSATSSTFTGNGSGAIGATSITVTDSTLARNDPYSLIGTTVALTRSTVSNRGFGILANSSVMLTDTTMTGDQDSAGIFTDGDVVLTNSTITRQTGSGGGAAGISTRFGTVTLQNSQLSDNNGAFSGGGISAPKVILQNSTMTDNMGVNSDAILGGSSGFTQHGSIVSLENSLVSGNTGGVYGGIVTGNDSSVTLVNSTVSNNTGGSYGGIAAGIVSLTNSQVTGNANQSDTNGTGGISAAQSLTLVNSTVSGNTSKGPGGGLISPGAMTLTNSTVSRNSTTGSGGGIYVGDSTTLTLTNSTLANNSAPMGSGIYKLGGTVNARNTIIANNTGSANCFRVTPMLSLGNNIDSGASCGFSAAGDQSNTDPKLGPLADNGGPTQTHALLAGSPAIDAGTNTGCPATDQRGQPRPADGNGDGQFVCDIGAFEVTGALAPTPTATPTVTPRPTATPTPAPPGCTPRPPVVTQAVPTGDGLLQVTVSASAAPGLTNSLQSITWSTMTGATVTVVGGGRVNAGQRTVPLAGSQALVFLVGRTTAGQAATVRLTVVDACGSWPTFVGGGPGAF